jgi:3-oxoacyl-[acyl-carrier protein] reductase
MEHFGRIDILVNSAAIFSSIKMKSYSELGTAEWDEVMAVNVRGTFLCCREFGGPMRDAGYGRIVNMSSGTVYMGRPNYLHYVTSKAAVIGLTRALSKELGMYGVTVNAIAPGSTKTEVARPAMTDKDADAIIARQAIKRRQEPSDLLSALTFLTEQSSDFVTGQTLIVDGGVSFS